MIKPFQVDKKMRFEVANDLSASTSRKKSGVECKRKSWTDWILQSEESSRESVG